MRAGLVFILKEEVLIKGQMSDCGLLQKQLEQIQINHRNFSSWC